MLRVASLNGNGMSVDGKSKEVMEDIKKRETGCDRNARNAHERVWRN